MECPWCPELGQSGRAPVIWALLLPMRSARTVAAVLRYLWIVSTSSFTSESKLSSNWRQVMFW